MPTTLECLMRDTTPDAPEAAWAACANLLPPAAPARRARASSLWVRWVALGAWWFEGKNQQRWVEEP